MVIMTFPDESVILNEPVIILPPNLYVLPYIAKENVLKLLEECGLSEDIFDKYPHQISGGQCQRAAIVRALALEPDILICDEATSALDVTVQKTIIELLDKIKQSRNLTIIFICHNMSLVKLFCDRYIVLDDGSVKEIVYNE